MKKFSPSIKDKTGIFVDINKPKSSAHCFSGESDYPTFELDDRAGVLIAINPQQINMKRVHIIVNSRKTIIPDKLQMSLHKSGVREIVTFTTDMSYLCPWEVLTC